MALPPPSGHTQADCKSEDLLRFVTEHAVVGCWFLEFEPDRLEWSPICKRLFGVPEQEVVSYERFLAVLHPEDRERVDSAIRACLDSGGETGYESEYRTVWPDGSVHWIHSKGSASFAGGRPVRMAGVALDITDRKQAEDQLRRSEALLRSATENASVGLVLLDLNRRYVFANRAYSAILGLGNDLVGKRPADVLAEVYEDQISPRLDRAFGGERLTYELIQPDDKGGQRYYTVVYEPIRSAAGQVTNVIVVVYDITAPKLAEKAVRKSEERLRFVTERAEVGYWDWQIEPDRVEWSPICKRLFGIPEQEAMPYARFLAAVHPEDREHTDLTVRACLESGGKDFDFEYRTLRPDGIVRWIYARAALPLNKSGRCGWQALPWISRSVNRPRRLRRALPQS